ncbi:MAG: hypothetical protein RIC55_04210 [Pirellulaceae bacterium]
MSHAMQSFLAVVVLAVALTTPLAIGLVVFAAPLVQEPPPRWCWIAPLSELPDDGVPRLFSIRRSRRDTWMRYPAEDVGAIYLRREPGGGEVVAFRCWHPMRFDEQRRLLVSCCWKGYEFSETGQFVGDYPGGEDLVCYDARVFDGQVWVAGLATKWEPRTRLDSNSR